MSGQIPPIQPGVCGLCRETLVAFNGRMRCSGCGLDYDLVPPLTPAQADAYVRRCALHLETHPMPGPMSYGTGRPGDPWWTAMADHELGLAFLREARRERREAEENAR